MIRKKRDYKAEYERRIARGKAKGLSYSQSRGHPKAKEIGLRPRPPIDRHDQLERALKLMKAGVNQKTAAKSVHVSTERLRAFVKTNTEAKRIGRKWIIRDFRPETYWIASNGRRIEVMLTKDEGTKVGFYWNAVNRFLDTNEITYLQALKSGGVQDVKGKYHPFELRPNQLRRLDSVDELNILEIYADVAN